MIQIWRINWEFKGRANALVHRMSIICLLTVHYVSIFKRFCLCYIYNGQSEREQIPSIRPFLLQKNIGSRKRQLKTIHKS